MAHRRKIPWAITPPGAFINVSDPLYVGLVGHWPMNSGAGSYVIDYAKRRNNIVNFNSATWGRGKRGSALSFTGASSWAQTNAPTVLTGAAVSISMWVYLRATMNFSVLIAQAANSSDSTTWDWGILSAATANNIYAIRNGANLTPSTKAITNNQWTHVVVVMNNVVSRTYFNAILDNSQGGVGSGNTTNIGGRTTWVGGTSTNAGGSAWINGMIYDIRVFERMLTYGDIVALYTEPHRPFVGRTSRGNPIVAASAVAQARAIIQA